MYTISPFPISIVVGGAGFIGANLCSMLLEAGRTVVVVDNLLRGSREYLDSEFISSRLFFIEADLSDRVSAELAFTKALSFGTVDEVWHLAANSDIPAGVEDADVDLKDTFLTTVEILRCMKKYKIGKLFFASSSAIYGDLGDQPLHEEIGPLLPISNYGAMKLASEAIISAAAESHLEKACLFRFPNVVGVPATHGVILDFVRKLKANNGHHLEVLGNGTQRKSYLHVSDLVSAMLHIRARTDLPKIFPINIGPIDEGVYVHWIAEQVVQRVAPDADIYFGNSNRGWIGDVPKFHYSTSKVQDLGWKPELGSEAAVLCAINEIACQEGF
ncbi:SDR family NAD(P)-dependent oxidoreductase [Chromobacterium paludis]|uniref:UDP-glucose 4-epimerase n=1 Tax=Chromobacterium paludis TaxID=2605945 RepID=A0A5C1DML2_9NEIS|nr:SDR family NAD(P)-dependent oxidoreductase [Chromobacterium paludis]QEL57710.1 SDR family NAD(P)-dependent oxidoreductase [Chromobacterium paludis]